MKLFAIPTTTVDHLPKYRKVPFIHSGYRGFSKEFYRLNTKQHYPWDLCFQSLFHLHNETVNIWTHLIPGFHFLYIGILEILSFSKTYPSNVFSLHNSSFLDDHLVFGVFSLCVAYSFLASTVFHFLHPISEEMHYKLRALDFIGISFNIVGSQVPLAYYLFYCASTPVLMFYLISLTFFGAFGAAFPFVRIFHLDQNRPIRVATFILMATFPIQFLRHSQKSPRKPRKTKSNNKERAYC